MINSVAAAAAAAVAAGFFDFVAGAMLYVTLAAALLMYTTVFGVEPDEVKSLSMGAGPAGINGEQDYQK